MNQRKVFIRTLFSNNSSILQDIGICNICNEKIYVSDLSHEENGWIFNQNGELISTGFKNRIKIKTKIK
ncbi:hypothetical protein K0040_18865 [Terrisporobacter petrolearius]|uniref:hypothetical protein n=1 Tax=Terrisporobacter petrolearius TaxID=1460447 RepID=UPI001D169029|nr:hypothetical protein [Terrisporobacter petrolearius]MCC3866311.1 hypothetical protein [Terrisporobacter petrolearius]